MPGSDRCQGQRPRSRRRFVETLHRTNFGTVRPSEGYELKAKRGQMLSSAAEAFLVYREAVVVQQGQ